MITTKALTGFSLLTAGTFLIGAPAYSANPACADNTLGAFSSPCTLDNGAYTIEISNSSGNGSFTVGGFGSDLLFVATASGSGSFDFKVDAASGSFFDSATYGSFGAAATLSPVSFGFSGNTDSTLTSLTGSLTYGSGLGGGLSFTTTQVPGPLPIVGAGLAFGYTRKLRKRINSAV